MDRAGRAWLERARRLLMIPAILAFAMAACTGRGGPETPTVGSGSPSGTGRTTGPQCLTHGQELKVVAEGTVFDQSCLAVEADTPFTVILQNRDEGLQHSVAIEERGGSDPIYAGDLLRGPAATTYNVGGLPEGYYRFYCAVHPTRMFGTLLVIT